MQPDLSLHNPRSVNILDVAASDDCASITPENADGSANTNAAYDQEEKLPVGRSMGQFVHLPDGKMVIVNGAAKGTAGYYNVSTKLSRDPWLHRGSAEGPLADWACFCSLPLHPDLF